MAKYTEISSIEELDLVQKRLKDSIQQKGRQISGSFSDIQSFYKPSNLLTTGIRKFTEGTPVDIYLIDIVRRLIRKRTETE